MTTFDQQRSGPGGGNSTAPNDTFRARYRTTLLLALSVCVPLGMGADECQRLPDEPDAEVCGTDAGPDASCGCNYEGKQYAAGEGFKSQDGCNDCSCQADGQVACTLRACAPPPPSTPKACAGITGLQCAKDEYCEFAPDAACGAADQTGLCRPKVQICPTIYLPVCGCDDKTYSSACTAAAAGVSVASQTECAAATGCDYGGAHHAIGETYPSEDGCNTCTCEKDGTSACTEKACLPTQKACGSRGLAECATGEYCAFDLAAQCGRADAPGVCTTIPGGACTRDFKPVCGCDDKTYSNACTAAAAGVSVLHSGECGGCDYNGEHYADGASFPSSDGCNTCSCDGANGTVGCTKRACTDTTCGGLRGAACATGMYCDFAIEARCGAADQTGTCRPVPDACDAVLKSVCACNDKTYENACGAAMAGFSVRAEGECPKSGGCDYNGKHYDAGSAFPSSDGCNSCSCSDNGQVACTLRACAPIKSCGGDPGTKCADTEYCAYTLEDSCGFADATGQCKPKPAICTTIFKPVCGCDGKTYASECNAANAGVAVQSEGECP